MKTITKKSIIYPLILVLVMMGVFAVGTDYSFGAETFTVDQGTRWVNGQNINSGLRITTTYGKVAYCLNQGRESPSGNYSETIGLTSKMKAVLYYGYPNSRTFGSITLTADQARCATQLAVWAHDDSGKGNDISLGSLHGSGADGDKVLAAAKWLYTKANAGYKAPSVPSLGAPTLTKPSNKTAQYFNSTHVRIGPYRYTTTTSSYASNKKISVTLTGAPSGAKLGDSSGKFISNPISGKDFYIYLPIDKLTEKASKKISMSASYDYKYEKAATFMAYQKTSTQNVALSTSKEYASGTKKANAEDSYGWTVGTLTKTDADDETKPVADACFELYYDPTPSNKANDDWKLMGKYETDSGGVFKMQGLGKGRYKLLEVKPNPDYAKNSEFAESDEIIFEISDVSKESIQVMTNKKIGISCQVDKDTIRKTSAAYRSLPGQEDIDNTGKETYRYNLDYRSTSDVWADEFTVTDNLEGVSENQIRVTQLWTPVSWGDFDGKMNVWYKTNKTDDNADYSDKTALDSNPVNPNNPDKQVVKKNTGFKIWAYGVSTLSRTNLKVDDLGLEEDEFVTGIRFEHGRVEKGFTTKNYSSESMNDDGVVDWTPKEDDSFYVDECASAGGLKPVTYLVMCPNPLSPPEVIHNSVDAFIARNLHLTDEDRDQVKTEVIDTFSETALDDIYPEEVLGEEAGPLGTKGKGKDGSNATGKEAKTGDSMKVILIIGLLLLMSFILMIVSKKKNKMMSLIIVAMLLSGAVIGGIAGMGLDYVHASSSDKFIKKQCQVDKKEVIEGLDSEDISALPESKKFDVRSDRYPNATENKELKRAGVSLEVSGHDEDGIPNKWDATIVYRGLEKYLAPYESAKETKVADLGDPKPRAKEVPPSDDPFDKENQRLAKKLYLEGQGYSIPEDATIEEMDQIVDGGWKTGDIIKFLSGLIVVAALSALFYFKVLRKRSHEGRSDSN